jgi:hypothetical protein
MTEEEQAWLLAEFRRCSPYIQEALDRDIGTHELPDVWKLIAERKAQLWPLPNSAVVTVLEYFPRKIVLRYWLCGGIPRGSVLKECLSIQDSIENWARSSGAVCALIGGRQGWMGVLPGFKKTAVLMTKAL